MPDSTKEGIKSFFLSMDYFKKPSSSVNLTLRKAIQERQALCLFIGITSTGNPNAIRDCGYDLLENCFSAGLLMGSRLSRPFVDRGSTAQLQHHFGANVQVRLSQPVAEPPLSPRASM